MVLVFDFVLVVVVVVVAAMMVVEPRERYWRTLVKRSTSSKSAERTSQRNETVDFVLNSLTSSPFFDYFVLPK